MLDYVSSFRLRFYNIRFNEVSYKYSFPLSIELWPMCYTVYIKDNFPPRKLTELFPVPKDFTLNETEDFEIPCINVYSWYWTRNNFLARCPVNRPLPGGISCPFLSLQPYFFTLQTTDGTAVSALLFFFWMPLGWHIFMPYSFLYLPESFSDIPVL